MRVDIDQAKQLLLQGKIVAFPTETVYGLGALATNVDAVRSVYDIKHRPHDNPLICHFASTSQIKEYTKDIPNYWDVLVSHFSPGPVSYLLPCKDKSLSHALSGLSTIICRIPNHAMTIELLEELGQPLVGPSANPSGQPSATNALMVEEYFGDAVSVIDGGSSWIGLESTILDCTQESHITILRPGQVGALDIDAVLERGGYHHIPIYISQHTSNQVIPGAKYRHYSPQTIIYKIENWDPVHDRGDIVLIGPTELLDHVHTTEVTHRIDLGSIYNPATIAHNLYHKLHQIDSLGIRHGYLLMWNLGDSNIERALADRLQKIGEWKNE